MQRDKGNNKESDVNNKKMTQGRKTIRTTKSKTLKLGDRPSMYVCNCRRMTTVQTDPAERGHAWTEGKWMKQQLQSGETMKKHKENP